MGMIRESSFTPTAFQLLSYPTDSIAPGRQARAETCRVGSHYRDCVMVATEKHRVQLISKTVNGVGVEGAPSCCSEQCGGSVDTTGQVLTLHQSRRNVCRARSETKPSARNAARRGTTASIGRGKCVAAAACRPRLRLTRDGWRKGIGTAPLRRTGRLRGPETHI